MNFHKFFSKVIKTSFILKKKEKKQGAMYIILYQLFNDTENLLFCSSTNKSRRS